MKWRSVRDVPGDRVIREVAVDVGRDLLLLGGGFLLVLLLAPAFPPVATIGKWAFALAAAFLLARFFFGCLVGLAESVLEGTHGGDLEGPGWIVFVTLARMVEVSVAFWMTFFLFRRFD